MEHYENLVCEMNKRLEEYGLSFSLEKEDNAYNLMFFNGSYWEDYACGYYCNELEELFRDAEHYARGIGEHNKKWGRDSNLFN